MARQDPPFSENASIAEELVRAHLTGQGVVLSSVPVPLSPASAMQVQALVQGRLGRAIGGWKVAIGPQQLPVAAPLLDLHSDLSDVSLYPGCTIEVELAVRLRKDLPKLEIGTYARADILDAIEDVLLGVEVIGGRFDSAADVPFLSFLADNLGNRAYVVGDSVALPSLDAVNGLDCRVTLDGHQLHLAPATHPAGDPLLPLLAYANAQSDHLGGLKAGQVVTTGSLCGVLPVQSAGLVQARVSQLGQVSLRFYG
jgi:2-keto-4-pentenoate hydratase